MQARIKIGLAICKVDDYIVGKDPSVAVDITTTSENAREKKHVPLQGEPHAKRMHSHQVRIQML